ncbi:MAG: molybdopterin-dependent oxidoreductase [Lentisphaerae bacterium]|jgi:DMSO/TMAO reductase YedYZ molybdopterin-dependent catalytic subunit|nr:molybdopterin-dependent oxidoreductase [Lentisphaerota bacterium]MBT4817497.1 molybdopterin-dependent oxidoreductase [Lentisphaerota bacterium]MBT5612989.1 molybdopterin-dependent oxidoreductase [Lentisphaerota bacterium]MBT7059067.1 molybdopterin-dependent oxidoreductase [Lentisphaerota bacterium]MBT7847091.1 molybdopterin-dependent oxidoreductase [Lentisphaerota bacterium]
MSDPLEEAELTPVDRLFTYHIFGVPDQHRQLCDDASGYRLEIGGATTTPVSLSLDAIKGEFAAVSAAMVLQCMTNVHWGRVEFTGARLLDVLESVGIPPDAHKIALHGADGFSSDLHLTAVREQPDAFLLAYAMNGVPISLDHGFPIRLTADGRYGYKWPKWLTRIELTNTDFKGHYEGRRGWSDEARRGRPVTG